MRRKLSIIALTAILTAGAGVAYAAGPANCDDADGVIGCCIGNDNYFCASGSSTVTESTCSSGKVCGWNASKGYYGCVSPPAESDPTDTFPLACGGGSSTTSSSSTAASSSSSTTAASSSSSSSSTAASSSSSSSGSTSCGLTTGDPTCDACIDANCCAEATACADDPDCVSCLEENPICDTSQTATDFEDCLETSCAVECSGSGTGGASASSSTTSGGTGGSGTGGAGGSVGTTTTVTVGGSSGTGARGSGGGFGAVGSGIACNASSGSHHDGFVGMVAVALAVLAGRRRRRALPRADRE